MTKLIPFLLVFTALSCYSENTDGDKNEPEGGEAVVIADLDTMVDFDGDLKYAQVVLVKTIAESSGSWRFDVTVRHDDKGWEHYADLWEVVDPSTSVVYGKRVLLHPHEVEQPFTRSQSAIEIPEGVGSVLVRARCTKHGFLGRAVLIDLSSGNEYEVIG